MSIHTLSAAVERYDRAIAHLEATQENANLETILDVLAARESAHNLLNERLSQNESKPIATLTFGSKKCKRASLRQLAKIIEQLDARLDQQRDLIRQVGGLTHQQVESIFSGEKRWQTQAPRRPWHDHFDWLWQLGSLFCFGISASLLIDIITRCLAGGIDTIGIGSIIGTTLLSLLSGGGMLTQFGQEKTGELFTRWRIPANLWDETRVIISGGCLGLLMLIYSVLPFGAGLYVGMADKAENLAKREVYYQRAIALDPGNVTAHLELAKLYVDQQEYDAALAKYKAVLNVSRDQDRAKATEAAEAIANIFLRQDNLSKADWWLELAVKNAEKIDRLTDAQFNLIKGLGRRYLFVEKKYGEAERWFTLGESRSGFNSAWRYEMLTHLGWARLKKGDFEGAKSALSTAITLQEPDPHESLTLPKEFSELLSQPFLQQTTKALINSLETTLDQAIGLESLKSTLQLDKHSTIAHCLWAQAREAQWKTEPSSKNGAAFVTQTENIAQTRQTLQDLKHHWEQCLNNQSRDIIADEFSLRRQASERLGQIEDQLSAIAPPSLISTKHPNLTNQ